MADSPKDLQARTLISQFELAFSAGKSGEAAALLGRAQAVAPDHPSVLNATGVQQLSSGQAEAARGSFERAIAQDAQKPTYWFNLACALRRLRQAEQEMAAIEQALRLEPRHLHVLLQKASLLEEQGKLKSASHVYHNALKTIRAGTKLPGSLRASLEHAAQAVRNNDAQLDTFMGERLQSVRAANAHRDQARFDHSLDALLGKRQIYTQQPTFLHFVKLPPLEFYPRADQLEPYINHPAGVPLDQWAELNHSPRWSVLYLWRDGTPVARNLERCPVAAACLAKLPLMDIPGYAPTAFFSILDAKSHIPAHSGATNTRLIAHLPLVIPPSCRFRVGSDTRPWQLQQAWVFDDTIEHEAWNDSDAPRAVLILDVWNPYLSEAERSLVRAAVVGLREYYAAESP